MDKASPQAWKDVAFKSSCKERDFLLRDNNSMKQTNKPTKHNHVASIELDIYLGAQVWFLILGTRFYQHWEHWPW